MPTLPVSRHARLYYRTGCNILLVSQLLGHSNVGTTMRYIGVNADLMRDAVEMFMPAKILWQLAFGE